jgi:peptidase E
MIRFVLHGGNTSEVNRDNSSFFREMTIGKRGRLKVLLNYFAREDKDVEKLSKQDVTKFRKHSINKKIEFKIAEPKALSEQLKWADVFYVRGGWTDWLTKKQMMTKNLEKLLDGKVVGGSSAGVYCWSKYYYGNDSRKISKGLGIIPIKAYCHYQPKDIKIVEKLTSYKERLPLLVLPNYKWVIMYK